MRFLFYFLVSILACGAAHAQDFSHPFGKAGAATLSNGLQWVSAPSDAAPDLPSGFLANPAAWRFDNFSEDTILPTTSGKDVWLKFTMAATITPQSWVIRIPRVEVQKVSLYSQTPDGFAPAQTAGVSIANSAWARSTRAPSFEVLTSNTDKTFYMRFEHHSALAERPELMSQTDFADIVARVSTLLGVMLGMFGMLIMGCIAAFVVARHQVFISLAAFVAASLLHYLVQMGYAGWRIWPDSVYLSQAMPLAAPLIAMAAGCWLLAQASFAKGVSRPVYRVLCVVAMISVALALAALSSVDLIQPTFINAWTLFVLWVMVMSLLWLSLRGMRGNLWLLASTLPIAAAGISRLAYNYSWLARIDSSMLASMLLTVVGLAWLFVAMIWRSRTALLSSDLGTTWNESDAISGLTLQRVALARLPQMLDRAVELKLGCGVIMLRWLNYSQLMNTQSPERQGAMLKHLGLILNRVTRDIDTAAHLDDGHFLILVEGPVNRNALSLLSTQILTACIRAAEKFDQPSSFNFHIAIWEATLVEVSDDEVLLLLRAQLDQMSSGTKRAVQFVDTPASDPNEAEEEASQRRDDLVAKIDAIEASSGVRGIMRPEKPAK